MFAMIYLADTVMQLGRSPVAPRQEPRDANDSAPVADDPATQSAVLTAERLYQRAHEIGKQLAAANPNDTEAQRDLILSHANLGLTHRAAKDYAKSVTAFGAALQIARPLKQRGLLAGQIDGLIGALEGDRKNSELLRDAR